MSEAQDKVKDLGETAVKGAGILRAILSLLGIAPKQAPKVEHLPPRK